MMTCARIPIVLVGISLPGFSSLACHRTAPVHTSADVGPVVRDTARVVPVLEDTAPVNVSPAGERIFKLRNPGHRDSLRTTLTNERALWRTTSPRDYQFLLRVQCFCPGQRGWLLMEVRRGELVSARDTAGRSVGLTDWNTFSIDGLFENLERNVDIDGEVRISFDSRWHFPTYIRTVALPGPDSWGIIEARGFRPL